MRVDQEFGRHVIVDVGEGEAGADRQHQQQAGQPHGEQAQPFLESAAQHPVDAAKNDGSQRAEDQQPLQDASGRARLDAGIARQHRHDDEADKEHGRDDEGQQPGARPPRAAPIDATQEVAQPPAAKDAHGQGDVHQQPRHLLAGDGIGDPTGDDPPDAEDGENHAVEARLIGRVDGRGSRRRRLVGIRRPVDGHSSGLCFGNARLRLTGHRGRQVAGDDRIPTEVAHRTHDQVVEDGCKAADAQDRGQEFVEPADEHVIVDRLAAALDALLRQPVAQAADDAGSQPVDRVGEKGGKEDDLDQPEAAHEHGPVHEMRAPAWVFVILMAKAEPEHGQPHRRCDAHRNHDRQPHDHVLVGVVGRRGEDRRVAAGEDKHEGRQERQHERCHDDGQVGRRAAPDVAPVAAQKVDDEAHRNERHDAKSDHADEVVLHLMQHKPEGAAHSQWCGDDGSTHTADQLPERQPAKEYTDDRPVHEVDFLGDEAQRHTQHHDHQVAELACVQVAEGAVDPHERVKGDIDVVADIARVEEQAGAHQHQDGRHNRARAPNIGTQPIDHRQGAHAKERGYDTRREIAVAKEEVHERVGVEKERPMHHGIVVKVAVGVQVVRVERVQALVVAHRARAEVVEARDDAGNEDARPHDCFPTDRDNRRKRAIQPALPGALRRNDVKGTDCLCHLQPSSSAPPTRSPTGRWAAVLLCDT